MRLAERQAAFGRWLQAECPEAAARLGGGSGLDVYLNNYRSQLIAALENGFPRLRCRLGATVFRAAAAQHVEAHPPRGWTLDAYGADFAETIAARDPQDAASADLARIEWGLAATFTAPDAAPVAVATLGTIDWDAARFRFVPGLALLPVTTNAAALWQALATDAPPPPAAALPAPGVVLLWRQGFHPRFRTCAQAEADAIAQLREGARFGALCDALAARHGAEHGAALAGAWLGGWLRDGLIAAIR